VTRATPPTPQRDCPSGPTRTAAPALSPAGTTPLARSGEAPAGCDGPRGRDEAGASAPPGRTASDRCHATRPAARAGPIDRRGPAITRIRRLYGLNRPAPGRRPRRTGARTPQTRPAAPEHPPTGREYAERCPSRTTPRREPGIRRSRLPLRSQASAASQEARRSARSRAPARPPVVGGAGSTPARAAGPRREALRCATWPTARHRTGAGPPDRGSQGGQRGS
jgi:hypothetical protein